MRYAALFGILCALGSAANADHLINIPLGHKVPVGTLKLEGTWDMSGEKNFDGYAELGIARNFEVGLHYLDYAGSSPLATLDLSYNVTPPFIDVAPGLSFGIRDVMNRTADGRRPYFATTFRVPADSIANAFVPAEATIGYYAGQNPGFFLGIALPMTDHVKILAEHDSKRINAGLEFKATAGWSARVEVVDRTARVSLLGRLKF